MSTIQKLYSENTATAEKDITYKVLDIESQLLADKIRWLGALVIG